MPAELETAARFLESIDSTRFWAKKPSIADTVAFLREGYATFVANDPLDGLEKAPAHQIREAFYHMINRIRDEVWQIREKNGGFTPRFDWRAQTLQPRLIRENNYAYTILSFARFMEAARNTFVDRDEISDHHDRVAALEELHGGLYTSRGRTTRIAEVKVSQVRAAFCTEKDRVGLHLEEWYQDTLRDPRIISGSFRFMQEHHKRCTGLLEALMPTPAHAHAAQYLANSNIAPILKQHERKLLLQPN